MIGYAAYTERMAGDLGLIDQIPHLRELGVTYLHPHATASSTRGRQRRRLRRGRLRRDPTGSGHHGRPHRPRHLAP